MTATGQNILKTLGYFDLFHYPLIKEEIYLFHPANASRMDIDMALGLLISEQFVFRLDEFYALQQDYSLAEKRRKGNNLANKQLQTAVRVAAWLSKFPYVKGIAVSGSLSKNFANEKTDIDFFIITTANRLWIARTAMHLYKKITYLTGRQHWFCMNYYVDEAMLEIVEKNIFTAMEIVTLVPMQGKSSLHDFSNANQWTKSFFPAQHGTTANTPEIKPGPVRRIIEKILNGKAGNMLDKWLMHITDRRWQKKVLRRRLNSKGICMGMVVDRHVSKPNPKNFQDKVVEQYRVKVQQLQLLKNKTVSLVL